MSSYEDAGSQEDSKWYVFFYSTLLSSPSLSSPLFLLSITLSSTSPLLLPPLSPPHSFPFSPLLNSQHLLFSYHLCLLLTHSLFLLSLTLNISSSLTTSVSSSLIPLFSSYHHPPLSLLTNSLLPFSAPFSPFLSSTTSILPLLFLHSLSPL